MESMGGGVCVKGVSGCGYGFVCVCVCGIMERNHIRQWKSCL